MASKVDFSLKKTKPKIGGGRVPGSQGLTSTYDLIEEMPYLFVKIFRARDLPITCVPFVEVKVGNYKGTTKFLKNPRNWEWHQVFAFKKEQIYSSAIEILVRDRESMNDEIMGCIKFTISSEVPIHIKPDNAFAAEWFRLQNKDGMRVRGELMLSVWMGTHTDDEFPEAWHSDSAAVSGNGITSTRGKVYITPRLWYLRVNIVQAQELVPKYPDRNPEVFVKATVGDFVLRTTTSKGLEPKWNEDLMFVVAEPFNYPLMLSVEDMYGANNLECLGKLMIPVESVQKRNLPINVSPSWYSLQRHVVEGERNMEVKFASRLQMTITLDGGYHVFDEPFEYTSDRRASFKLLWPRLVGVLNLGILNAKELRPMKIRDGRPTTDAYCVVKYGPKWARTRTIVSSLEPRWNEQHSWEVYDPHTVATMLVFDNAHLAGNNVEGVKDQLIGKVRIRLSTLNTDEIYTYSYPLLMLQPNGLKKMGEIQLAVRFSCSSFYDLYVSHARPVLPVMHYSHALSVYQLDTLRDQARHVVSLRLGRAEPPLRKEVVDCMLDGGLKSWSFRRGRASLARLISFFNVFTELRAWFYEMCNWKNMTNTILIHMLFLIVVFNPKQILPALLFSTSLVGTWRYLKRPTDPLHFDVKLSYADTAHPDELAEEMDTFPSSATGEVLIVRHDRLRFLIRSMEQLLGDLAHQLERLQSVLTWRDRRATLLYMILFCMASVVSYFLPLQFLVTILGFFVMRHPRMRVTIPSIHENLFKRLPGRTVSLL